MSSHEKQLSSEGCVELLEKSSPLVSFHHTLEDLTPIDSLQSDDSDSETPSVQQSPDSNTQDSQKAAENSHADSLCFNRFLTSSRPNLKFKEGHDSSDLICSLWRRLLLLKWRRHRIKLSEFFRTDLDPSSQQPSLFQQDAVLVDMFWTEEGLLYYAPKSAKNHLFKSILIKFLSDVLSDSTILVRALTQRDGLEVTAVTQELSAFRMWSFAIYVPLWLSRPDVFTTRDFLHYQTTFYKLWIRVARSRRLQVHEVLHHVLVGAKLDLHPDFMDFVLGSNAFGLVCQKHPPLGDSFYSLSHRSVTDVLQELQATTPPLLMLTASASEFKFVEEKSATSTPPDGIIATNCANLALKSTQNYASIILPSEVSAVALMSQLYNDEASMPMTKSLNTTVQKCISVSKKRKANDDNEAVFQPSSITDRQEATIPITKLALSESATLNRQDLPVVGAPAHSEETVIIPKRQQSAYSLYVTDMFHRVREFQSFDNIRFNARIFMKLLGCRWKAMNADQKTVIVHDILCRDTTNSSSGDGSGGSSTSNNSGYCFTTAVQQQTTSKQAHSVLILPLDDDVLALISEVRMCGSLIADCVVTVADSAFRLWALEMLVLIRRRFPELVSGRIFLNCLTNLWKEWSQQAVERRDGFMMRVQQMQWSKLPRAFTDFLRRPIILNSAQQILNNTTALVNGQIDERICVSKLLNNYPTMEVDSTTLTINNNREHQAILFMTSGSVSENPSSQVTLASRDQSGEVWSKRRPSRRCTTPLSKVEKATFTDGVEETINQVIALNVEPLQENAEHTDDVAISLLACKHSLSTGLKEEEVSSDTYPSLSAGCLLADAGFDASLQAVFSAAESSSNSGVSKGTLLLAHQNKGWECLTQLTEAVSSANLSNISINDVNAASHTNVGGSLMAHTSNLLTPFIESNQDDWNPLQSLLIQQSDQALPSRVEVQRILSVQQPQHITSQTVTQHLTENRSNPTSLSLQLNNCGGASFAPNSAYLATVITDANGQTSLVSANGQYFLLAAQQLHFSEQGHLPMAVHHGCTPPAVAIVQPQPQMPPHSSATSSLVTCGSTPLVRKLTSNSATSSSTSLKSGKRCLSKSKTRVSGYTIFFKSSYKSKDLLDDFCTTSRKIAAKWREMTPDEQAPFCEKAKREREAVKEAVLNSTKTTAIATCGTAQVDVPS